ncbi:hypothetical protein PIB30_019049 [Stylosanthes scabra]|uniref:Uncharacterized protein n=1 Tax=Stylosanthes scabra TaxID=79078 RepID=A0ABU6S892_9FABA|nr:hypothetical protein [Stylosanthes scabra]
MLTSFSAIVLGYAEELVRRRHIFLPRLLRLGTPFKVIWTIVKEPDLNIGVVCGENSYSKDKKRSAGGLSGRWTMKSQSTTKEEEVDKRNQTIQQLEPALRELLERQTQEAAIASEAVKRAEELAKK